MAIWPFGRKGKRPRSQIKASDAADRRLSLEGVADKSPVPVARKPSRKPSRKRSKRDKHRSAASPPRAAAGEPDRAAVPVPVPVPFAYNLDNHTSFSSIGQDNFAVARATPMLQKRSSTSTTKGNTLKKRLSKRSAREIQREREIKALSSSPPPNQPATWGYPASDVRRGPSVHSRDGDNHTSNQSLRIDSRSSMSDSSDLYTYKVNAFAVLAPRPIIRYSEYHPHNKLPPRSTNPSANRDLNLGDEDDWNSQKRVAELADDLDAGALRELLERDRRRREKKRLQDQERKQLRLQRRLEREQEQPNPENAEGLGIQNKEEMDVEALRGRDKTPSPATSSGKFHPENDIEEEHAHQQPQQREEDSVYSQEQSASWLREPSKDSEQRQNRYSDISAHVIGNIDDRSIRAGKSGHDSNTISEDEASRHRSPLYQAVVASTSSAHMSNSLAQESISDLSRTENSEKRLSDTSRRRMASWISFLRRPSLRKRSSREVEAPPSEFSNTSRDSFMRAAQSQGLAQKPTVPIPIPERSFRRTGVTYRSQSKFVEHLGDYPISPPDSRMQSPVPVPLEAVTDMPAVDEMESGPSPRRSLTDGEEYNYENDDGRSRPMSWDDNSGMLSQSLASIDSEGSWMSGRFLRQISQQQNSNYTSWRSSTGQNKLIKYDEAEEDEEEGVASDEFLNQLAEESAEEEPNSVSGRRASSAAMGLANAETYSEDSRPSSNSGGATNEDNTSGLETWHGVLERKPTVVRRESGRPRAVSKEVVLGDYDMLDTSSIVDEDNTSPISPVSQESETIEVKRATSIDLGRGGRHARQMSAGSAKLLEIAPRESVDSSR